MRIAAIAIVLVALASPAHARRGGVVVFNSGEDILHVRDLTPEQTEVIDLAGIEPGFALGYRYELFGLFWLDVWRSSGEFVLYRGTTYYSLTDQHVATLGGASVPWGYYLPPGLVVILALLELAILRAVRPTARTTYIVAGVCATGALVGFLGNMPIQCGTVGFLALFHAVAATQAMRQRDSAIETAAEPGEPERERPIASRQAIEPAVALHRDFQDPFRGPPQAPPIVTTKPSGPAKEAPIVPDDSAPPPRLLR